MNTVSVIGRLTKDPELRHTQSGTELCSLRIAVDRAGPKQDDGSIGAGFFDVSLWGKTAEVAAQYLSRGKQVGISGELRWREWQAEDGTKRQAVEINGRSMTFVGSKDDNAGGGSNHFTPAGGTFPTAAADDDIPF